jgi:hypothetical protein
MGPDTSSQQDTYLGLLDGEDEGTTILLNVGNYPTTRRHIPDLNLQQQRCEKLRSRRSWEAWNYTSFASPSSALHVDSRLHGVPWWRLFWLQQRKQWLVQGQARCSLSRLITLPCTVLVAQIVHQQLTRCKCEGEGGETLITVLRRSVCQGNTCVTFLLRHVDKACGRFPLLWVVWRSCYCQ